MEIIDTLVDSIDKEVGDKEKSVRIVRQLTRDFGGGQVYIPQERYAFREEVEDEIYRSFDGCNIRELSMRYKCSRTTIREIIKRVRKRRIDAEKASQGRLL